MALLEIFSCRKLLVVLLLGFASGLPMVMLTGSLQAWFATSGQSILYTGFLSLLGLPYLFRFLVAPFVDKYTLFPMGRRRSWILLTQIMLFLGFYLLPWIPLTTHRYFVTIIAFILVCISAIQDIAIDAHRTEYLPQNLHGLGASLAIFGYRIAILFGGGVSLIIAYYLGWIYAFSIIGSFMLLGILAIIFSEEPHIECVQSFSFLTPINNLMSQKYIWWLIGFIFFYKFGEAFTSSTSGIVMPFLIQGIGFSLDTIAYFNKILGLFAVVAGGLGAGFLLLKYDLKKLLLFFGILQTMPNLLFALLAVVGKNKLLLALAVLLDNFAAGLASTALITLIMKVVDTRYTATQFSILVAIATIPRIISGPLAASIQSLIGWSLLYQTVFAISFVFIIFWIGLCNALKIK